MKKMFVVATIAMFAVACTNGTTSTKTTPTDSTKVDSTAVTDTTSVK